ncbi:DEAD/DEAH box helicase, partial [Patescibacteria group bacterium]|nr:DEAD/DEAH box helicase [Patescibacteria group bacterium]
MSSSNQQYREVLTLNRLLRNFPKAKYPDVLSNQRAAFELIADTQKSVLLEMPTGSGKTAVGHTYLKTLANAGVEGPLFYLVPTKALVDQVKEMFPDVTAVYGRNEYDCLYYEPEETFKADEIPCLSLLDCAHRVDQETGQTLEPGATP